MKFKLVESMKVVDNNYITYSKFDLKGFLLSNNEYYRISYLRNEGLWIISKDSVHYQMLLTAEELGYIEDADEAIARVEHYYYLPWDENSEDSKIWTAEWYVSENYHEINDAAVYSNFILGSSIETSIELFQTFIDIFGEPTRMVKSLYSQIKD